ncbi:MAG: Maf-like protein [Pseudomonadota bacterium]
MASSHKLVLASGSPRRLQLLQQIGLDPDFLAPVNADETPRRGEAPRSLAKRLSKEKADLAKQIVNQNEEMSGACILTADTVVGVGRRVLPKAEFEEDAMTCLQLLSGRNHRVYTSLSLVSASGSMRSKLVETRVRFKRLSRDEIEAYIAAGEWRGKAGGYAIQGIAGSFAVKIVGSYTNVVGLPLYEAMTLLGGEGFTAHKNWTGLV